MDPKFRYFKIIGGAVRNAIAQFETESNDNRILAKEFIKELGAKEIICGRGGASGFIFEPGKAPTGWVKTPRCDFDSFRPGKRAEGREAILERMKLIRSFDAFAFQELVLGDDNHFYFMQGLNYRSMFYEKVLGCHVLIVPRIKEPKSDDEPAAIIGGEGWRWQSPDSGCIEIKASEYWALKEATAEAAAAAASKAA